MPPDDPRFKGDKAAKKVKVRKFMFRCPLELSGKPRVSALGDVAKLPGRASTDRAAVTPVREGHRLNGRDGLPFEAGRRKAPVGRPTEFRERRANGSIDASVTGTFHMRVALWNRLARIDRDRISGGSFHALRKRFDALAVVGDDDDPAESRFTHVPSRPFEIRPG